MNDEADKVSNLIDKVIQEVERQSWVSDHFLRRSWQPF